MNDDQQALVDSLEAQERRLVFTRFDNADAWRLGSLMVTSATERALLVGQRLAARGTALDEALGVEPRLFAAHGGVSRSASRTWALSARSPYPACPRRTYAFVTKMISGFLSE